METSVLWEDKQNGPLPLKQILGSRSMRCCRVFYIFIIQDDGPGRTRKSASKWRPRLGAQVGQHDQRRLSKSFQKEPDGFLWFDGFGWYLINLSGKR